MTKIVNIPDVSLSAVEDIGNIVFKAFRPELSGALNVTLFNFCHVLRNFNHHNFHNMFFLKIHLPIFEM